VGVVDNKGNLPPSALRAEAVKRFFAVPEDGLREVRCPEPCGKMLGEFAGAGKIVCPRCGRLVKWE
jgi:hypothetical protein